MPAPRLKNRIYFYRIEVGQFALATEFYYMNNSLQTVYRRFLPKYFDEVKEVFVDKYGPPTADERSVVQNGMGAACSPPHSAIN